MLPFTLQQLTVLKAIATEKNFTKAAELLYLSQPYLSKQVKVLEKNLNIVLINREKNRISLTENGQVFLQYAERILALCEESCRALIDLKNAERGIINIGASQTIGTYLLPQVLVLFTQKYPQIALQIHVNSTRIIAKNVLNREVDLAIVGGEVPIKLQDYLLLEEFVEDEFNLIVSNFHPFACKQQITKEDLYHLNFITLNSQSTIRKFIDNILSKNHIETNELKILMQLNSLEGIKTAVSLGLGAAFVSSSAIEKELKLETIRILKIENIRITRKLSIISNSEIYKSKAFQFFYKELLELKKKNNKL